MPLATDPESRARQLANLERAPGRRGKCFQGHDLNVTGVPLKDGRRYCGVCRKLADKRRRERKREQIREYHRIWSEAKRRERGAAVRKKKQKPKGGGRDTVPAGPLAEWLRDRKHDASNKELAIRYDTSEKRIQELVSGKAERIGLDTADRILMAADWHLMDLYPDLYPEEDQ